jgi:hypothetical protein
MHKSCLIFSAVPLPGDDSAVLSLSAFWCCIPLQACISRLYQVAWNWTQRDRLFKWWCHCMTWSNFHVNQLFPCHHFRLLDICNWLGWNICPSIVKCEIYCHCYVRTFVKFSCLQFCSFIALYLFIFQHLLSCWIVWNLLFIYCKPCSALVGTNVILIMPQNPRCMGNTQLILYVAVLFVIHIIKLSSNIVSTLR